MAIEFLSDDQAAAYGRFTGPPERAELERFFFLDDADRALVGKRRGDHNRLGFSLQLGTARFIGLVPRRTRWTFRRRWWTTWPGNSGIADASSVKRYAERQSTQWERAAEIRQAYGYRDFTDDGPQQEIRAFIAARAWTRTEGPRALFDQSVAWLRGQKILLPGASILARLVSEVRNSGTGARLHQVIASAAADADAGLPRRLVGLLDVPDGSRVFGDGAAAALPVRASAPQMVRSLDRASELLAIGAGKADLTGVQANRVEALARYGLGTKAPTLRGLTEPRRTATLWRPRGHLEVSAVDDVLDLFTLLMATKLLAWAERESNKRASATCPARAGLGDAREGRTGAVGRRRPGGDRDRAVGGGRAGRLAGQGGVGDRGGRGARAVRRGRRGRQRRPGGPSWSSGTRQCGRSCRCSPLSPSVRLHGRGCPGPGRRAVAAGPGGPQARPGQRGRRGTGGRVVAAAGAGES